MNNEWETPEWLFQPIAHQYGLTFDACASAENYKLPNYFTKEQDALTIDWYETAVKNDLPPRFWMNPPYSTGMQDAFLAKARAEAKRGCLVVALIVADLSTGYWNQHVMKANEIWAVNKRIAFGGSTSAARFSNAVAIYLPKVEVLYPAFKTMFAKELYDAYKDKTNQT